MEIIKYKSWSGEPTTKPRSRFHGAYWLEKYDDDLLKEKLLIENEEIREANYYLTSGEDLDSFKAQKLEDGLFSFFYINPIIQGVYRKYDFEEWSKEGEKLDYGVVVFDDRWRRIYQCNIDAVTNKVYHTRKYFYIEDLKDFYKLEYDHLFGAIEFSYNREFGIGDQCVDKGAIWVRIHLDDHEDDEYRILSDHLFDQKCIFYKPTIKAVFNWEKESYYHSDSPVMPVE